MATHQRTTPIDKSTIRSVYSGRAGKCCCGCSGNHRYASKYREESGKTRGYPLLDEDVSDRSVSIIVNRLNRLIAAGDDVRESPGLRSEKGDTYFSYETEHRLIIAYTY